MGSNKLQPCRKSGSQATKHVPARVVCLLLSTILLVFCSTLTGYSDISASVSFDTLKFAPLLYSDILRGQDGSIVAFVWNTDVPRKLAYCLEGQDQIQELHLPQDPACTAYTDYRYPSALPDGRLGLVKICGRSRGAATIPDLSYYDVAYNWQSHNIQQLVEEPLPTYRRPGYFSWSPKMSRGVQGAEDGLTGTNGLIYWLTPVLAEPMQLQLTDGQRTYDLGKSFFTRGQASDGMVSGATWSPDGESIAFFGSLDTIGEGLSRIDANRNLYLLSVQTNQVAKASDVAFPATSTPFWSPDGSKVAFIAFKVLDVVPSQIWVFERGSRKFYMIASDSFFLHMTWSENSKDIIAIWAANPLSGPSTIREYHPQLP